MVAESHSTNCVWNSLRDLSGRVAARQVEKLPQPVRGQGLDAISDLLGNPRPRGARKIVGEQTARRIRIGNHRVIRDVFDEVFVVSVVRAGYRRDVYRR